MMFNVREENGWGLHANMTYPRVHETFPGLPLKRSIGMAAWLDGGDTFTMLLGV